MTESTRDFMERKVREGDSKFAVAFAILEASSEQKSGAEEIAAAIIELSDQQREIGRALERIGFNGATGTHGALEYIGMQFEKTADALQQIANKGE